MKIREADLRQPADAAGFLAVLESYAQSVTGGGERLAPDVKRRLVPALLEQRAALVLLALHGAQVVGVASCFFGFSTFKALPLLNIHDLAVLPQFQGQGIGGALLAEAEERARARGCCKLTLEVLETNAGARRLYEQRGFRDFELGGVTQRTLFLSKVLALRAD